MTGQRNRESAAENSKQTSSDSEERNLKHLNKSKNAEADEKLVSAMFLFGWNQYQAVKQVKGRQTESEKNKRNDDIAQVQKPGKGVESKVESVESKTESVENKDNNQVTKLQQKKDRKGEMKKNDISLSSAYSQAVASSLATALHHIDQQIPENGGELREKFIFKGAMQQIKWQRDNYLAGQSYANFRKDRRENETSLSNPKYVIPYDPTALGYEQVARLASNFIPTSTVQNALIPLVVALPNQLYEPLILPSVINIIYGQQENVNYAVKNAVLTFLKNPANRETMKNSAQRGLRNAAGGNQTDKEMKTEASSKSKTSTDEDGDYSSSVDLDDYGYQ